MRKGIRLPAWPLIGIALTVCATILCIVTMLRQEDVFTQVLAVSFAGLALSCLSVFVKQAGFLSAFVPCLYLLAGLLLLVTQFSNIGYALYHVNIGDGIMPTFVISFILYLAGTVAAAVGSFTRIKM